MTPDAPSSYGELIARFSQFHANMARGPYFLESCRGESIYDEKYCVGSECEHVSATLLWQVDFEDAKWFVETYNAWPQIATAIATLTAERDEALNLADRSTRRLAEMAEPGFIGAFARRDAAIAERDQFKARLTAAEEERDEARAQQDAIGRDLNYEQDRASAAEEERDRLAEMRDTIELILARVAEGNATIDSAESQLLWLYGQLDSIAKAAALSRHRKEGVDGE